MRIGLDIDGVLADIAGGTLRIMNNMFSTDYTLADWNSWYFASDIVGGESRLLTIMEKAWDIGFVGKLEPNIGDTVDRMKEFGVVTVISKRTYLSHPAVIRCLHEWKVKYDNIVLLSGDNGEEKLEYPIDVLIDDHPSLTYFSGRKFSNCCLRHNCHLQKLISSFCS